MEAAALEIRDAGAPEDLLVELSHLPQAQYLRSYLNDLEVQSVLVEPRYFDRDYLSEFASFYCTSSAGYANVCERHHYFSMPLTREMLEAAVSGDAKSVQELQDGYLGFIVRRPIPATPFGRTVLRWYPDKTPDLPRVTRPSRRYACHIAGIRLGVEGLAWQQQDAGVGACATVALWSMLHSSAFDDRHVVPTTAEVTRLAHGPGLSVYRAFPSRGLSLAQLIATVRDFGFAPLVVDGDRRPQQEGFRAEHFSAALASLVRSGFPVLLAGRLAGSNGDGHAVCAVGFRQASAGTVAGGKVAFEDAHTEFVYLHDDNLGPAIRFRVDEDPTDGVILKPDPPPTKLPRTLPDPTLGYPGFYPTALLAAAHEELRVTPDQLHKLGLRIATSLCAATGNKLGLSLGSRFLRLASYLGEDLEATLGGPSALLGKTRLALVETVPPMSLHVGVVRFGVGGAPLLDVLYDTTDSEPNTRAFCHVAYHPAVLNLVQAVAPLFSLELGVSVAAY